MKFWPPSQERNLYLSKESVGRFFHPFGFGGSEADVDGTMDGLLVAVELGVVL